MRIVSVLFVPLFLLTIHIQNSFSQDKKTTHTFKIIGETRGWDISEQPKEIAVEYDPSSTNHLFITYFGDEGIVVSKKQYTFNGKKFYITGLVNYLLKKELQLDGLQIEYRKDGSVENEQVFANGNLQKETSYYPDGKRQLSYSAENQLKAGEYKMWHQNGQLNFSGNYKNNLKDGEFQEFNDSGVLLKAGIYKDGKLISGVPVVQDVMYDRPEKQAVYIGGDEAFDEYLKRSSTNINALKTVSKPTRIDLRFLIDKTGRITDIENVSVIKADELSILNEVFKELPVFSPATEEGIPVASINNLNFILSADGLKRNTNDEVFANPDKMAEFSGGVVALRNFLASNVRYPKDAQISMAQGKVFVNFIVNEDGTISKVTIARGVHYLLDEEAIRVVKIMPKWIPGQKDGKPVRVSYTVPINFMLH